MHRLRIVHINEQCNSNTGAVLSIDVVSTCALGDDGGSRYHLYKHLCVSGYHIYRDAWMAAIGKELVRQKE